MNNELRHHGIKGQKWGVRRYQNKDGSLTKAGVQRYKDDVNSKARTIKEGTEVQTISKKAVNLNDKDSRRSKRLYVSYTEYDKDEYVSLMGNFMYGGDESYKNTFVAKKDIKVASDRDVVKAFIDIAKKDPVKTAKDMANAYNETSTFLSRSEKTYTKKLTQLSSNPDDKKSIKLAEEFVSKTIMGSQSQDTADNFYGYLVKKGFDAISDTNDRKGGAQDPLIILNMNAIEQTGAVKLTADDLEAYWKYTMSDEHTKRANDVSRIQR